MTTNKPPATGLGKFYDWFWKKLGSSKPFTYHIRSFYHNLPAVVYLMVSVAGGLLWKYAEWWVVLMFYGFAFIGMVVGHLHWGEMYNKDTGAPRRCVVWGAKPK